MFRRCAQLLRPALLPAPGKLAESVTQSPRAPTCPSVGDGMMVVSNMAVAVETPRAGREEGGGRREEGGGRREGVGEEDGEGHEEGGRETPTT